MAGKPMAAIKVEEFLNKEQIAEQMNVFVQNIAPDAEIDPEKVVEVPSDGCPGHFELGEWHTWCARWGEFLVVAIDANGVEASVSLH